MVPARFAPVLEELAPLAERFADAGHRLYLVGGAVRDLLVGVDGDDHDLDLTTDARPPEIKQLLGGWGDAVWTQGERFGTIGAQRDRPDGTRAHGRDHDVPVRGLRRRLAQAARHVRRRRSRTDLGRRDFTINAMALELGADGSTPRSSTRTAVPPTWRRRRCARRCRPEISFDDDPLRMLRAARFIAGYGLHAGPRAGRRRAPTAATAWRSCRRSASATSWTS